MHYKVGNYGNASGFVLKIRCPACGQRGTFESISPHDVAISTGSGPSLVSGQRRCPDPDCLAHVFFISRGQDVLDTYPAERIDFDSTNVPSSVVSSLEEALACHAGSCYVAAAIMVRKTLEELCRDRGATGANLKDRVRALGDKVLIPAELLEGLDDLRLLGNDAAHIESRTYDQIGKEEVEIGIEFAKEVLKAVYQYSTLLARLRSLKKAP